jgi:serine/threonine-protein kinase
MGDVVLVRPGDRIPVDGEVLHGQGSIDQSPITGESVPVVKGEGDSVFAGTINHDAALDLLVTRLAKDNTLQRIMEMVAGGLAEAHELGIIHRDIKPANIFLCRQGGELDIAKVLDFGLVKDVGANEAGMTELNVIPGTPPYIAPERLTQGAPIDGRVDIYALGAVAFNLLTGAEVFEGETSLEIAYKTLNDAPRRPSEAGTRPIPRALDDLVNDMLARSPDERPADVARLLARLDRIAAELPWDQAAAAAWWAAHAPARPPGGGAAAPAAAGEDR